MNILFVFTGGTIGSGENGGVITVRPESCRALKLYQERFGRDDSFTVLRPFEILSENLEKKHWQILSDLLHGMTLSGFNGIIIAHGSDTLSYTSAMMSFCLSDLQIPVILTAADRVPDDPESNAVDNIRGAVVLLRNIHAGVFTVYRNPGEKECSVFLASRIREADRLTERFTSFDGHPFGIIINNDFVIDEGSTSPENLFSEKMHIKIPTPLKLERDVLMIRPYPSLDYSSILLSDKTGAVLHLTYHSSTASIKPENSALSLLKKCRERNIPFYLASFGGYSRPLYETSSLLLRGGAIPLFHISDEAAYAKALLCCSLQLDPVEFMNQSVCGEIIE